MPKNTFGMRNTQYSIELSVHKQPRVFNTTYTIQCRVNCPNIRHVLYLLKVKIYTFAKKVKEYCENTTTIITEYKKETIKQPPSYSLTAIYIINNNMFRRNNNKNKTRKTLVFNSTNKRC